MGKERDPAYCEEVARLTPSLRRFARALVRNHSADVSDNLVQATLKHAIVADQERRGSRLLIWLVSVLTRLHREQVRMLSADKKLRSEVGDTQAVQNGPSWRALTSIRTPSQTLLSNVPLECREVLLLVVLEKMSYVDIAETLDISLNTVLTRLARARDGLAQAQSGAVASRVHAAGSARPAAAHLRVVK